MKEVPVKRVGLPLSFSIALSPTYAKSLIVRPYALPTGTTNSICCNQDKCQKPDLMCLRENLMNAIAMTILTNGGEEAPPLLGIEDLQRRRY